ncbi:MAG: hypothetical protein U9N60_05040 [Thermodesulfobacteriota bacterium]|nr:hypothetical protein [Thermodesulfobacteriota bacterium]
MKWLDWGFMDARKSAQALLGFDEAVRFFVFQQAPDLRKTDFEFPVRVKKGSWEIVIPEVVELIKLAGSVVVTAYGIKAAQKMAERDFEGIGLRDIFQKSLLAIQLVIKIGKHLGDLTLKKFESVRFKDNNQLIGIKNSEGEFLYVPKEFLNFYVASNPRLLGKISELVEEQRVLSVGVYQDGQLVEETVTRKYRSIFTHEEEEQEEMLFPELEHGQEVALEGEVTKGNEMSNTMGLRYQGHILTMLPETGSIVRFKPSLFLKCCVRGLISRSDDKGKLDAKKPKIIFSHIEPIENDTSQSSLFE